MGGYRLSCNVTKWNVFYLCVCRGNAYTRRRREREVEMDLDERDRMREKDELEELRLQVKGISP